MIPLAKMLFTSRYLPKDPFCRYFFNFMRIYLAALLVGDALFIYMIGWGPWSQVDAAGFLALIH
ncbi:MAG: hypothetical protein P8018_05650 [Acidobacteriota bacterium]